MGNQMTQKAIKEYHEKFSEIPKDYKDRLVWLIKSGTVKKKHLDSLLSKVDELQSTAWQTITYIFYMEPMPSQRPRLNSNTFTFYVPGAATHKQMFDRFKAMHSEDQNVISTPCILDCKVYTKTPSSMSPEEKLAAELELIHNLNAPDWDNIGKLYCDMIQETLISNDSVVCKGVVEKLYSCLPRVEVNIHYMTKYDCKYNKRSVEKRKSFYENPLTVKDIDHVI